MILTVPDYYRDFRCTGGECPDNCCIGWEIDIDNETYDKYMNFTGTLGQKLKDNIIISDDGSRCFRLGEKERCPFLNQDNLCEIILEAGEDMLCEICDNHPRFHNCFGNLRETGVGVSCIRASEMLVNKTEKTTFVTSEINEPAFETDYDLEAMDYFSEVRELLINTLQDRSRNFRERLLDVMFTAEKIQSEFDNGIVGNVKLHNFTISSSDKTDDYSAYKDILSELIPLNEEWTALTERLSNDCFRKAGEAMLKNDIIAEQLMVYYIFRHFLSGVYDYDMVSRVKFAVFCTLASFAYTDVCDKLDSFTDKMAYSACLVSKEIEYCTENIDRILDISWENSCMSTNEICDLLRS